MIGTIILAAGSSTRMGEAKQNLIFKGQTLLQAAIKTALASESDTVAVVLGGNAEKVFPTIANEQVHVFFNNDWEVGMGTSISCGLNKLLEIYPNLSSVLFMLTDQPFVDSQYLNHFIGQSFSEKIVASAYNDTLGPPVLFDKAFFGELAAMQGNEGAKKIIQKHQRAVIRIPFQLGSFDIDTQEDYARLGRL